MKLIKHILCFALAVLMLLSVVACDSGSSKGTTAGGDDEGETTVTENRVDDLPEIDMGGKEIVMRSMVQECNANSFDAKYDGDIINNAVYERNTKLQERLKCVITVNETVTSGNTEDMYTEVSNMAGGEGLYDIVTCSAHTIVRLAVEGLLIDLASQEFIDLDKDYYDDGYNDALNAGGRQYLVTGKMTLAWYRYQMVTLFNRNIFKAANMNTYFDDGSYYPYQTVLDGDWTTARMSEVAAMLEKDLDGNGTMDKDDQWGYYVFVGSGSSQTDGFMAAFDLKLLQKNADGYYEMYDGYDPTDWNLSVSGYLDLIKGVGSYASNDLDNIQVEDKFTAGEAGMITYRMYVVESEAMVTLSRLREGYGIIPLPKADDDQEDYISYVQDQVMLFGIPRTVTGEDRVQATQFLEAFASESYNITMPAYYEQALTKKYVADVPSRRMIEIIDSNIVVDPVNVYYGKYFNMTTGSLRAAYAGTKTVIELLDSAITGGAFQAKIDSLNTMLQALDEELKGIGE